MVDLRDRADWSPLVQTTIVRGCRITTWTEPRLPGEPHYDLASVVAAPKGVRAIVVATALPTAEDHPVDVVRKSVAMAGGLTELLRMPDNVDDLLDWADQQWGEPHWKAPTASTAIVEATSSGITAWRHGDCQVWVQEEHGQPQPLFTDDTLTPDALEAWENRDRAKPEIAERRRLLSDPQYWLSGPIGLPGAARQKAHQPSWRRCVVTTDGARLTATEASNPLAHLASGAQVAPQGWPYPSPHGAIALIDISKEPTWDSQNR